MKYRPAAIAATDGGYHAAVITDEAVKWMSSQIYTMERAMRVASIVTQSGICFQNIKIDAVGFALQQLVDQIGHAGNLMAVSNSDAICKAQALLDVMRTQGMLCRID